MSCNLYQTKVIEYTKLMDGTLSNSIEASTTTRRIRALSETDKYKYDTKKFAGCVREERAVRYDNHLASNIK